MTDDQYMATRVAAAVGAAKTGDGRLLAHLQAFGVELMACENADYAFEVIEAANDVREEVTKWRREQKPETVPEE